VGWARAIIANSNYGSVEEARAAIERYVRERNEKFRCTPKRAGGKIWGMEREPAWFSASNNCKAHDIVDLKSANGRRKQAYRLTAPVATLDVPVSVQAVLASRIDRLPAE
jgi:hypothetical protein